MPQYDVFLSHNHADQPAVEELARRLVQAGVQPWLDTWNLIPGEPWQEAIEEALDSCATCAVFVGPSGTGPWQNEEMRAAIQRRVDERRIGERPFRVIPVLLPGAERGERSRLPSFLVATTWVEFHRSLDDEAAFHRLVCGIQGLEPGPGPGQAPYAGQSPYRGLQFFDVEHAPFFFGREALTEWLLDELRSDNRFLAIVGPSGSGKSSLARAGLVAALRQGQIEGSAEWPVAICRPGPDPLESLAVGLSDVDGVAQTPSAARDLIRDLRQDQRMLHLTTRLVLRDAPPERRLALLIDQFEEIFTLCHGEALRQAFVDNLLYAAGLTEGQTVVLVTLRADFYGKCAAYPALAAALSDRQVLVGPMSGDELWRAIERPAQLAGCEFEAGLVQRLLDDVRDQPGGLPLLQHALLELWDRREARRLTHAAYRASGGVAGALERRAEAVYNRFTGPEKEICRRVFLRLTQPGEGTEDTKRRATLWELMPADGSGQEAVEATVHALADARLITTESGETLEGERYVEVAHEALIQGWSRLRKWIEQDREALHTHRRLTEAAGEWQKNARDESYLYRGTRLTQAEEWTSTYADDLNPLEREFLTVSLAVQEREQTRAEELKQRLAEELERRIEERIAELEREGIELRERYMTTREFVSVVVHEMRTPMTSIKGFVDLILLGAAGDVNDQQRHFLSIVRSNVDRLAVLMGDFLDLSRIETGQLRLTLKPTSILDVLHSALDAVQDKIEAQDLELTVQASDKLPPVVADHGRLIQVLVNLITNACQYNYTGGQILIRVTQQDDTLQVTVTDTGIGISAEDQDRVFDRFFRAAHPLVQESVGSGLGLSIAKSIVETHGGRIWVDSQLGVGSTFAFCLPLEGPTDDVPELDDRET
jgi:signal transduction histidine kinase